MQTKPPVQAIWESLRTKPELHPGGCSITALFDTINAYEQTCYHQTLAQPPLNPDDELILPRDFDDWVAYRLRFFDATSGWRNMLLDACGNEAAAFWNFFELLDQHHARKPRVFAAVRCGTELGPRTGAGISDWCGIRLVTFTDDPGYFALWDLDKFDRRKLKGCDFYPLFDQSEWTNPVACGGSMQVVFSGFEILDVETVRRLDAEVSAHQGGRSPFRNCPLKTDH